MTLRPSRLHHLDTPASALRSNLGPRHQPGLDGLAGHLRAALDALRTADTATAHARISEALAVLDGIV